MAEELRSADLRRLLAVVEAARWRDIAEGLPTDVLAQARDLVRRRMAGGAAAGQGKWPELITQEAVGLLC